MTIGPLVPVEKNSKAIKVSDWQNLSEAQLNDLIAKNNGGNLGVRLDHYAVLDPDEPSAEIFVNSLERDGKLPPTIAWKTARGFTKRLFRRPDNWPFASQTAKLANMKLELRSGAGVQDVIPPSYVIDKEKGIDGGYVWISHQSPSDIEPASFPLDILDLFVGNKSNVFKQYLSSTSNHLECKGGAKTVTFDQPGRDESLFHVANALFKAGEPYGNVLEIIERLASTCNPPFSPREAQKKVESAQKRVSRKERNIAEEVREFVIRTEEDIKGTTLDKYLDLRSTTDKETARKALRRLQETGLITKIAGRRGLYRRVEGEAETIDFDKVDTGDYWKIKWPFRFELLIKTFPRNLCVIAGASNAGKTAFLLDFCRLNMKAHGKRIRYISTEMDATELRERLDYYVRDDGEWHTLTMDWKINIDFRWRAENIVDLVMPNWINIIDFYEAEGEFYNIAKEFKGIRDKLERGICLIALQKKPKGEFGYGGALTEQLPRFVINIDRGVIEIKKAKNLMPGITQGADGTRIKFKLVQGYKWLPQNIPDLFWWYNYDDKDGAQWF